MGKKKQIEAVPGVEAIVVAQKKADKKTAKQAKKSEKKASKKVKKESNQKCEGGCTCHNSNEQTPDAVSDNPGLKLLADIFAVALESMPQKAKKWDEAELRAAFIREIRLRHSAASDKEVFALADKFLESIGADTVVIELSRDLEAAEERWTKIIFKANAIYVKILKKETKLLKSVGVDVLKSAGGIATTKVKKVKAKKEKKGKKGKKGKK